MATTKKKTPAKKTGKAVKPAATGITDPAKSGRRYSFDVLADDLDIMTPLKAALTTIENKRKNRTGGFHTAAEIRQSMIPLQHFYLQQAMRIYGIPQSNMMRILGGAGLGKTTLAITLAGGAMLQGCPVFLVNTEVKKLTPARMKQALHRDPRIAARMLDRMLIRDAFTLEECEEKIIDYVDVVRGRKAVAADDAGNKQKFPVVPLDTPVIVIVDTWSKLMNPGEAAGFSTYGVSTDKKAQEAAKKKFKATGTGSTFGHAKYAQAWSRRLPYFLSHNNVALILVEHQNDNVQMAENNPNQAAKQPQMPADVGDLYNEKVVGGRAFKQNAALTWIVVRKGLAKDSANNKIGTICKLRVAKNSFGPDNAVLEYTVNTVPPEDPDTFLPPAINMDLGFANWLVSEGLLGTRVDSKKYTSKILGVTAGSAEELSAAFHANTAVMEALGKQLKIEGYADVVGDVKALIPMGGAEEDEDAPPPPPDELSIETGETEEGGEGGEE